MIKLFFVSVYSARLRVDKLFPCIHKKYTKKICVPTSGLWHLKFGFGYTMKINCLYYGTTRVSELMDL